MNKRLQELIEQAGFKVYEGGTVGTPQFGDHIKDGVIEKFAELIVRELVANIQVEGSDFYHNEFNDYGCITVEYFVPGNAHLMRGEEVQAEFVGGVIKGTGRFRLNERFVEHLMKRHFGDKE
jgi:hypothetical protein